jgi:hypothetical protein
LGIKKPRPQPGFFAWKKWIVSRVSSAENTRPKPAATAAVSAADISAVDEFHG